MVSTLALPGAELRYTALPGTDDRRTPTLLLHPWFGCQAFWDGTANRLPAPSYAVDWYSLGDGDWSRWAGPEQLAEASVALLDSVGAGQVDVSGNSVGGIVAQLLASRHPDRVRRLVLVGTGASLSGRPSRFGELVSEWISGVRDRRALAAELISALVASPLPEPDHCRYLRAVLAADPDFVSAVLVAARSLDLRPELSRISAPTLVIRGERDTARSREHVDELLRGIAGARAVEMAGCGHSPMIEQPDQFHMLLEDHLSR